MKQIISSAVVVLLIDTTAAVNLQRHQFKDVTFLQEDPVPAELGGSPAANADVKDEVKVPCDEEC